MQAMKKVGRSMSICMAITLSFFLSLTGNLVGMVQSGRFDTIGFVLGFVISVVVSFIIGLVVPMGRIHVWAQKKFEPGLMAHYIEALISDLIYTPLMTTLMVVMAYFMARNHGAAPPFLGMYLPSLGISLVVGYLLVFIFQPLYMKALMKKYGVNPGGPPEGRPGSPENRPDEPNTQEWHQEE